jgi:cytidylate kinase
MIIAIDGPAGAGKSTVARRVARELGLVFLDTGAMYRAVTWRVLQQGLDPANEEQCARVARSTRLTFDGDGHILVDGREGEPHIRSREVTAAVSAVSAHASVRTEVVREQQTVAAGRGGLVAEGRDTTTVVFPNARHKFFLIATSTERARRRALELGQPERQAEIQREIEERDRLDTTRAHSPLVQAKDALVIDTDVLTADLVVARILEQVRRTEPRDARAPAPADAAALRPAAAAASQREPTRPPPVQAPLVRITFVYWLTRALMNLWYLPYFRRRVRGREFLPATGGVLIAANHQSYLDIPLIAIAARRHVCFVARRSLSNSAALAYVMRQCGAVLVEPGKADRAALREMVAHLEAGDCVAIFPEGTRSEDGSLRAFKAGALMAARSAGVPIVPCAIRGTFRAWGKGVGFPRPSPIELEFAPPLDASAPEALESTRAAIARLLEPGAPRSL